MCAIGVAYGVNWDRCAPIKGILSTYRVAFQCTIGVAHRVRGDRYYPIQGISLTFKVAMYVSEPLILSINNVMASHVS